VAAPPITVCRLEVAASVTLRVRPCCPTRPSGVMARSGERMVMTGALTWPATVTSCVPDAGASPPAPRKMLAPASRLPTIRRLRAARLIASPAVSARRACRSAADEGNVARRPHIAGRAMLLGGDAGVVAGGERAAARVDGSAAEDGIPAGGEIARHQAVARGDRQRVSGPNQAAAGIDAARLPG
jgi:hypothetical protein